jgi:CubicO group peptidase (beta-lactamase class C family)
MTHLSAGVRWAVVISVVLGWGRDAARADAIDDYVRDEMRKRHIPGVAVAVVREGKVSKVAGYGLANVELNVAVSPTTVFQIQSITKTFTSTAILMLMEEGKLDLADPIGKHLEGTPDSWKPVTLRHLLSHTSGIKDFINEPTASLRIDVTEEEVLAETAKRPVDFKPGEKYAYSNTNYHLLAMVIRKLTGKSYGEFLKERIFVPLGMTETRIVNHRELIANRASGYVWSSRGLRNGDYVAESILGYGGGGIVSTAADMAKWAAAFDGERLLKRATIEKAWAAQKLNDGKDSNYGLGWALGAVNGRRWVGHGGAHMTGFTSHLLKYRDDPIAVVVLTNARNANPSQMARVIAGMEIPALAPPARKVIEDKEPKTAELVKEISRQIREGRLEEKTFTPALWKSLSEDLGELRDEAQADGKLKKLELLDRGGGTSTYRMVFENRAHIVRLTVDDAGKVSGLWAQEE